MKETENQIRFEKKYIIPSRYQDLIDHLIYRNKARFIRHHNERIVNSVYLDTSDFQFYRENINGLNERKKFRIRWYGNGQEKVKAFLEIKMKKGHLGKKIKYEINSPLSINSRNLFADIKESLRGIDTSTKVKEVLKRLEPTLYVSYKRKYFISNLTNYRLTIDNNLLFKTYSRISTSSRRNHSYNNKMIVEFKYDKNTRNKDLQLFSTFPFRMSRHSKYVIGLSQFKY